MIPGAGEITTQEQKDTMQWARKKCTREEAQQSRATAPMQGVQQFASSTQTQMVREVCDNLHAVIGQLQKLLRGGEA